MGDEGGTSVVGGPSLGFVAGKRPTGEVDGAQVTTIQPRMDDVAASDLALSTMRFRRSPPNGR